MNEEKNNTGVNNSLPPMGSVVANTNSNNSNNTNNVQNKYGLPPIANFTNFNDNYSASNTDNNVSVFDLMGQFDAAVPNNNVSETNNINNNQSMNSTSNVPQTNVTSDIPSIFSSPITSDSTNTYSNNISQQSQINQTINPVSSTPAINANQTIAPFPASPVSNANQAVAPVTASNTSNINQNAINNNINSSNNVDVSNNQNNISSFFEDAKLNINNVVENNDSVSNNNNAQTPVLSMFSGNNNSNDFSQSINSVPEILINSDNQTEKSISNSASDNNLVANEMPLINKNVFEISNNNTSVVNSGETKNTDFESETPVLNTNNDVQEVANNNLEQSISNKEDNNSVMPLFENPTEVNNDNNAGDSVIEIETTSVEDNNDLITSFDISNNIDANNNNLNKPEENTSVQNINNNGAKNTKVKKSHKFLFIILALITFILLVLAGIIGYFMFLKTDKLVCGKQDYSNEEFLLDESMVIRFKGNNMTNANLTQKLTFTEESMEKKDSYLEELKNQYQGLGFNISFVDNEDGFEINMGFTKQELENWYGFNIKNSSKTKLKKEMRESGYTCK